MIAIKQTITRKGLEFSAKEWRGILKEAWAVVGEYWHKQFLPKHFTIAGAHEYGYQKRTKKYERQKARKKGHHRPIVWSGETERQAKRWRDVRISSKGARVVLRGLPRHIWMAGWGKKVRSQGASALRANRPNLPQELMTVSDAEARELAEVLDKELGDRANADRGRTVNLTGGHRTAMSG